MKVAIVGSRGWPKMQIVVGYICQLPPDTIIVDQAGRVVAEPWRTID